MQNKQKHRRKEILQSQETTLLVEVSNYRDFVCLLGIEATEASSFWKGAMKEPQKSLELTNKVYYRKNYGNLRNYIIIY